MGSLGSFEASLDMARPTDLRARLRCWTPLDIHKLSSEHQDFWVSAAVDAWRILWTLRVYYVYGIDWYMIYVTREREREERDGDVLLICLCVCVDRTVLSSRRVARASLFRKAQDSAPIHLNPMFLLDIAHTVSFGSKMNSNQPVPNLEPESYA